MELALDNEVDAAPARERAPDRPLPSAREVATGLVGLTALGAAGAVGAIDGGLGSLHAGVWTAGGAAALSGPMLLVAHQFLGLAGAPEQVVGALARAVARGGALALGLVPLQLFLSATTQKGPGFLALWLLGLGALAVIGTGRDLVAAERAAAGSVYKAQLLSMGWGLLCLLVGLRLGVEVLP